MVGMLFRIAQSGLASRYADGESVGFSIPSGFMGFVVLGLIAIPVIFLVASAVVGAPRGSKVPGLFLACLGLLISATIVGFALIGKLLGFVVPS